MNTSLFGRLQVRLQILILLSMLPTAGLLLFSLAEQRRDARVYARTEALRLMSLVRADQERQLEGARQFLAVLARAPAICEMDTLAASRFFANLRSQSPLYENIGLATLGGRVISSGIPLTRVVDISDRAYFQRAVASRDFAIGDYQVGRITGRPAINFAHPVFGPKGDLRGILFVARSLDWFTQLAVGARLPQGSAMNIIDGSGTILARYPEEARWIGQKLPFGTITEMIKDGDNEAVEANGMDGVRRLYVCAEFGEQWAGRLFLCAGFSMTALYAAANRAFAWGLIGLGVAAFLALLIAWLGGELLVLRRIRTLGRATERLRRGDLTSRTGLRHGDGELGRLASAFDHLAESLEQRETERRRAEDEIRREKEFSTQLIESSADGIIAFDRDLHINVWNSGMERITALPRAAILGRPAPAVLRYSKGIGDERRMREVLSGQAVVAKEQAFDVPETGRRGFLDGYYSAVRDEAGQIIGGLGIIHDTTKRRLLEEQFRQSQKMEAIGRLAGGVAHDFNNLLTVIQGFSDLILHRLKTDSTERKPLEEIRKAAGRAAMLTGKLLLFSRQDVVHARIIDLNAVVTDMDQMIRRLIGEDIEFTTTLDPNLDHVLIDPGHLEQVIMNLAVNARDAMPHGGRLVIETTIVKVDESYTALSYALKPGEYVVLTVSDTGSGMDKGTLARLFEPFFTTKEADKGTGLGLATVYGIVKQAAGDIHVYSEPGHGATFRVYLPGTKQSGAQVEPEAPRRSLPSRSETVLVAEDEDGIRRLVHAILVSLDYTVLEARDGDEALLVSRQHSGDIDLVITDIVMPQLNGPELIEQLLKERPEIRVLYMSGYAEPAIRREGVVESGAAFITKPFGAETLVEKVRRVLDGGKERAA